QTLRGYSALNAGLVLSPAGFVTMLEMPIIGFLLSKRLDARWLMVAGMATVAFASFWMSELNLMVAPGQVILPRCIQTLGAGMMIVPINAVAYLYIPKRSSTTPPASITWFATRVRVSAWRSRRHYSSGGCNFTTSASASTCTR